MSSTIFRRALFPRATTTTFSFSSISSSAHASPSPPSTSSVATAVSILTHHRSKSRWSALLSLFPHGFTPPQTSQILLGIRNNPHLSLRFFLFTTRHSLSSLHSYATIIHILARGRHKTRAKTLIKSAIREFDLLGADDSQVFSGKKCKVFRALAETYRVCDSAPFVFDLLILSLLEMNKLDPCIDIVRMLHSRAIYINASTCIDLIVSASKIRGCFFGYDVYREVFGYDDSGFVDHDKKVNCKLVPNVHIFNELMLSFHRNGLLDMVEEVWIEMVKSNCEPNSYSYSILMAAYCEDNDMEKAEKVWEELRGKGLNPDIVGYNTLIGGYCRIGEVRKGEELYKEMGLRGLNGSFVTYEHLIGGYCLCGDYDSAMLLYNDMRRKGFNPNSLIVDSLVRILCGKRSVSEGLEFFRVAMKNADFVVSESSYQLLIEGLCDEGMTKEALTLQAQMAGKGFKPNSQIYDAFIDGYMKIGNTDEAENLRKEMMDK
ncbi:hypothetical protein SOVF_000640 [Spinacia oleracea]|nr:hypothetical protein SOVF_000640 [Spinacia oleracea]